MNFITVICLLMLAVWLVLALRSTRRQNGGCGRSCGSCPGCADCTAYRRTADRRAADHRTADRESVGK